MQDTLRELVDLLVAAVPTILLLAFLTVYLNRMLFRPIAKILDERKRATEGARELAQQAYEAANKRHSEYASAFQAALVQIHSEQEELRRRWAEELSAVLVQARSECEARVKDARREMLLQVEQQKAASQQAAELLSESAVETLLRRRAA
jgi:F-type H+-transporting ATPase subunit b